METLLKSFSLINQSVSQKHIIVRSSVFVITHIKWLIYGLILSNHMYTHTVHTHRHMHTHLSLQPSVSCADYHPHTHSRRVEGRSALIFSSTSFSPHITLSLLSVVLFFYFIELKRSNYELIYNCSDHSFIVCIFLASQSLFCERKLKILLVTVGSGQYKEWTGF